MKKKKSDKMCLFCNGATGPKVKRRNLFKAFLSGRRIKCMRHKRNNEKNGRLTSKRVKAETDLKQSVEVWLIKTKFISSSIGLTRQ